MLTDEKCNQPSSSTASWQVPLGRAAALRASLVAFGLTLILGLAVGGCHARADEMRACGELCGFRGAESFSVEHPSDDPRCVCRSLADGGTK